MDRLKRFFILLLVFILIAAPISVLAEEEDRPQTIITHLPSNVTVANLGASVAQIRNNQIVSAVGGSPNLQNMVYLNTMLRQLTEHTFVLLHHHSYEFATRGRIVNYLNSNLAAIGDATTHVLSAADFSEEADAQLWGSWRDTVVEISLRSFSTHEEALAGLQVLWGNVAIMHRDTALLLNNLPNHHLYLREITETISSIRYMQGFPSRWDDERNRIVPEDLFDQSIINDFVNTSQFNNLISRNEMDLDDQVRDQINVMAREFSARLQENIAFVTLHSSEALEALYLEEHPESPYHFLDRLTGAGLWDIIPGTVFENSLIEEQGASLRDFYLAGFAATAAHIPFISRSGDEQFLDVVTYLLGVQDNVYEDHRVRTHMGEMLQFTKPLFAIHGAQRDAVTPLGASFVDVNGPSTRLTLAHLIYAVENEGTFAAGVFQGRMIQAGDTWEYFNVAINVMEDGEMFVTTVVEEDAAETSLHYPIRVVLEVDGNMQMIVRDRNIWQIAADGISRGTQNFGTFFANVGNRLIGRNDRLRSRISGPGRSILENPTPGSITYGLMVNILQSLDMRGRLVEIMNQPLLLTVFGDIITADGMVVLPAAANPTFFAQPVVGHTWMYNPFTAAFFNSYPVISGSLTNPMVANNRDMGKWFFTTGNRHVHTIGTPEFINSANHIMMYGRIPPLELIAGRRLDGVVASIAQGIRDDAADVSRVSFLPVNEGAIRTLYPTETAILFPYFLVPHIHTTHPSQHIRSAHVMSGTVYIGRTQLATQRQTFPIQLRPLVTGDGITILPHYFSEVNSGQRSLVERRTAARMIGANMLAYITQIDGNGNIEGWGDESRPSGSGILRETFMFVNVALPVLDGMVHPRRYYQNALSEHMLFNQDAGVFSRHFRQIAHSIISNSFQVENFIGVSSPTDGSVLSPIYRAIHRHWAIVFLLFSTVLLVMFVFTRNFTKTLLAGGSIVIVAFLALYLVPITMPTILGNISNTFTRRLVQQSMLVRGENHAAIFSNETDGFMGSLKLYNMSMNESMNLRRQLGYDTATFMTESLWLDDRAGVFLQGTEIRIDMQTLWTQNTMSTRSTNNWSNFETPSAIRRDLTPTRGYIYSEQLHLFNRMPNISMVNYYMPYLFLQDGLVYTLNQFLRHYRVPRAVIQFVDGNVQDSYIVASFIRSIPFLAILPHVQMTMSENIAFAPDAMILRNYFPNPGDIFQLQWLVDTEFSNLPPYVANTVWGQTMRRTGFYDTPASYVRRQLLVNYVNDAGYRFFINIAAQPGLHSDENLIKLASLEATFAFNRFISEWGDMVYPQHFSTSYLSVGDIIAAGLIHQNPFFMAYDIDILPIVLNSRGYAATFSMVMVALFMMAISFVNGNLAILYVLMVLFSIAVAVVKRTVKPALVFAVFMSLSLFGLGFFSISAWHVFWWLPYSSSIHWLAVIYLIILIVFIFAVVQTVKRTMRSVSNTKTNEEDAFGSLKNKVMRQ